MKSHCYRISRWEGKKRRHLKEDKTPRNKYTIVLLHKHGNTLLLRNKNDVENGNHVAFYTLTDVVSTFHRHHLK